MRRIIAVLGLLCVISTAQAQNNEVANACFQESFDLLTGGAIKLPENVDTNDEFREFLKNLSGGSVTLDHDICLNEINNRPATEEKVIEYKWENGQCKEKVSEQVVSHSYCTLTGDQYNRYYGQNMCLGQYYYFNGANFVPVMCIGYNCRNVMLYTLTGLKAVYCQ